MWCHYMCMDEIMPMMEVEAVLCQSSALVEHRINAKSDLVQYTVFHCVCTLVLVVVCLATPLQQASLKQSQVWVWNVLWFWSKFRLRWAQRAIMHVLLEEHCTYMVEDLAMTGACTWSLNEKMYKLVLATVERILPTFVIVFIIAGCMGHVCSAHVAPWHACGQYHADDGGGNHVVPEQCAGRMQ